MAAQKKPSTIILSAKDYDELQRRISGNFTLERKKELDKVQRSLKDISVAEVKFAR